MSRWIPTTYKTTNWSDYNKALKQRGSLSVWFDVEMAWDARPSGIRAIEVTSSSIGDAPMLPDLLEQIPPDQDIGSMTADGAFDTRKCHNAIAARDAHAVIPPRKKAKLWKAGTPGARARNEDALFETARSAPFGTGL